MVNCIFCDHDNPVRFRRCRNCGADLPEPAGPPMRVDDALEERVRSLMDEGQKIEAIKLYRERTGAGLKDSKDAVEAIGRGEGRPRRRDALGFQDEVVSLLEQGQKIGAIKLYRERTGVGLKEAKDAVEALAERRGIAISRGAGCFGVVVVAFGFLAGALAFADDRRTTTSEAQRNEDGFLVNTAESPHQSGKTEIRVLMLDNRGSR